jgi:hypothetical protein
MVLVPLVCGMWAATGVDATMGGTCRAVGRPDMLRMCGAGIFTVHCGVIVVWLLGCFLFTNQGRFLGAVPRDSRAGADELIAKRA